MMISKLVAMALCTIAGATATQADAPDTPQHRKEVREAVAGLLSPLSVTLDMVEQIDMCHYRINRPKLAYQRLYDFTKIRNVSAFTGILDQGANNEEADVTLSGSTNTFTCKIGGEGGEKPYDCDNEFTFRNASQLQFRTAHSAAAAIFVACTSSSDYKVCPGGMYRGFRCAYN